MRLHNLTQTGFAMLLLAGTAILPVASPHAQTLESARVRLPSGQVITVDDGRNWYADQRVVTYKRYYYEPRERVYVVYNDDDHHHGKKHHEKKGHFCPPGQAKKGNC